MIDPRTRDIYDPIGGHIPYPGTGGDIALPPTTRITGMFHDGTMPPAAYDVSESIQVDDLPPAAPEMADLLPPSAAGPRPAVGVDPMAWRRARGLEPPLPEGPQIGGMPDIGPDPADYPGPGARADAAARTLAPGAFQYTADPWGSDGSLADTLANLRGHALIDAKYGAAKAAIARNAVDPMREELEARRTTAALEDAASVPRPLIGAKGAFTRDPRTGAISNNAPAETLSSFRQREASNLHTILGAGVLRQLQDELGRIERGTSLNEDGEEAPLAQAMTPDQKEQARKQAFKTAALALQNYAGGKDFSGFFRETYDPNAIRSSQ